MYSGLVFLVVAALLIAPVVHRVMLREDLVAERVAIDTYREIIRYLGDNDPTTRRMLESILASEEEHAEDLGTLLSGFGSADNAPFQRKVVKLTTHVRASE